MDIDTDKIDEAVLALLYLTLHDDCRAWKGHDFEAMNRLHEKGYIDNPVNKAKSVTLTDTGLREAERLFNQFFARSRVAPSSPFSCCVFQVYCRLRSCPETGEWRALRLAERTEKGVVCAPRIGFSPQEQPARSNLLSPARG